MIFKLTPEECNKFMNEPRVLTWKDVDMFFVNWLTKPEIIADLLPAPLKPGPMPLVMTLVGDYPWTDMGCVYKEGALFLMCEYDGVPGFYNLAMEVTDDMAMAAGRELFGFPKKMATITYDRDGETISGSISRKGELFYDAKVDLAAAPNDPETMAAIAQTMVPEEDGGISFALYCLKHFTSASLNGFDYGPKLIRQKTRMFMKTTAMGSAEVSCPVAKHDPWHVVSMEKVLGGFNWTGDMHMHDGVVVAECDPEDAVAYSALRWDGYIF